MGDTVNPHSNIYPAFPWQLTLYIFSVAGLRRFVKTGLLEAVLTALEKWAPRLGSEDGIGDRY